jgi:ABC-type microcin C transport system permease subunit YejB
MEHQKARGCRLTEFERWPRRVLEHERSYLSRVFEMIKAYAPNDVKANFMHDLADIDFCLSKLPVDVET